MDKKISFSFIAVALLATAFTSCNNAVDVLKMNSVEVQKEAVITALNTRSDLSDFVAGLKGSDFSGMEAEELTVFAVLNCHSTDETECEPVYIKRHIVAGKYTKQALTDSLFLTSFDGTQLLVTVADGDIYVNGMKLGNEIPVGKSVVYIVDGAIPAAPQAPEISDVDDGSDNSNCVGDTDLKIGETTEIKSDETACNAQYGLSLRVASVNDSRCPQGVMCVWAGNASAAFQLTTNRGEYNFTLDIHQGTDFKNDTIIEGVKYQLRNVLPYPVHGEEQRIKTVTVLVEEIHI
jgi:hypothetical protein